MGATLPFDILSNFTDVFTNTFVVSGGSIDAGASVFVAQSDGGTVDGAFTLNFLNIGSALSFDEGGNFINGVLDSDSSTLVYSSAPTATTPEPSSLIGLAVIGGGLLLSKRVKG